MTFTNERILASTLVCGYHVPVNQPSPMALLTMTTLMASLVGTRGRSLFQDKEKATMLEVFGHAPLCVCGRCCFPGQGGATTVDERVHWRLSEKMKRLAQTNTTVLSRHGGASHLQVDKSRTSQPVFMILMFAFILLHAVSAMQRVSSWPPGFWL